MNRRIFLASTAKAGVVCASGFIGERLLAQEPGSRQGAANYQIGCYTRPFDKFDYRVGLDAIVEAGFRYLGLMTTNTKEWDMIRPTTPPEEVQSFRAEANQRGLKIISVFGDFSVAVSVEQGIRELKRLIDHTEICGCPSLMFGGTADEKLY